MSQLFNQTWLCRYPIPKRVRFDNRSEFKKNFIPLLKDFVVKPKPTSIKTPQSNTILEMVHQVLGVILCTYELKDHTFGEIYPWGPILQYIAWTIRSAYHTNTQASLGQLVFGRNMLFIIPYTPDWGGIRKRKKCLTNKRNKAENKSRVDHDYEVNG